MAEHENGTKRPSFDSIGGIARTRKTDAARVIELEAENKRLSKELDNALAELRTARQKLETANAAKRSGDLPG